MNVAPDISLSRPVRAELEFQDFGGRTHLMRQHTPHPFHITRPFRRPNDPQGMATLYLQSSSGGLYGGDDLGLRVRVAERAAAHVTTQAGTIVHDARGNGATQQSVTMEVEAGGWLEYLPDPTILMAGSALENSLCVRFAEGARLLMADAQLCHDPAGQGHPFAHLDSRLSLSGPEGPRLIDQFSVNGADWLARTGGARCSGMIIAAGAPDAGREMAQALTDMPGIYAGLSEFADRDLSVLRFLADDGVSMTSALNASWIAARLALTGVKPHARRK